MTRRSITAVLAPLLVGLLISVSAPAVGADAPCILDNAGNCAAAAGREFTTQQIAAFDALSGTAPNAAVVGGSPEEYDIIRTALEMAGTATTAPVDANLTGRASEPYQRMTTWSVNS
jgi:hypothetical protein